MSACEECWNSAYTIARLTGRHQVEVYRELIAASPKSHDQSGLPTDGCKDSNHE